MLALPSLGERVLLACSLLGLPFLLAGFLGGGLLQRVGSLLLGLAGIAGLAFVEFLAGALLMPGRLFDSLTGLRACGLAQILGALL